MDDGFDIAKGNLCAPTAANAAVHHLHVDGLLKTVAEHHRATSADSSTTLGIVIPFTPSAARRHEPMTTVPAITMPVTGNVYEFAERTLHEVVRQSAIIKNVLLEPHEVAAVTTSVLDRLELADLYRMAAGDLAVCDAAARVVGTCLDEFNVIRLAAIVSHLDGRAIDDPVTVARTGAILRDRAAWPDLYAKGVWPNLVSMVLHGDRTVPSGPVVSEFAHDVIITAHSLDSQLHRDSADGPAREYRDGTRSWTEFRERGELHRPHTDGPAFTYSHFEGREIAGEEYYRHGVMHRSADEGPALRLVDRAGNLYREIYIEHGLRHRDGGPAWRAVEDGCLVEEYCRHGVLHRDPSEGPAVIARDGTGRIIHEEFWCDGQLIETRIPAPKRRAARKRKTRRRS